MGFFFVWVTPSGGQSFLLILLRITVGDVYVVPGITMGSSSCKASALTLVINPCHSLLSLLH